MVTGDPSWPACVSVQVTQLGHVKDLATAFAKILGNAKAARQVYNISGERFVTFDGIARACAEAAGAPEPEIIHFNAKEYDFDGKKPFPLRDQHFFTSIDKARPALAFCPAPALPGARTRPAAPALCSCHSTCRPASNSRTQQPGPGMTARVYEQPHADSAARLSCSGPCMARARG